MYSTDFHNQILRSSERIFYCVWASATLYVKFVLRMLMMDCGSTIFIFLAVIQATFCQTVIVNGPTAIEQGSNAVYTCERTGGSTPYIYTWTDISVVPNVNIFIAGGRSHPVNASKYVNFDVSENGGVSTMTITNTQIEDEGQYRCGEGQLLGGDKELEVEVESTRTLTVKTLLENNVDIYEATCRAIGGRPLETITWMLDDELAPCADPGETNPPSDPDLYSIESVCKFEATADNYGKTLKCFVGGHQVTDLNGEETQVLNMHSFPGNGIVRVMFEPGDLNLMVTCDIDTTDQPTPSIRNYYIYANDTLKHKSSTGVNSVEVPESEYDLLTEFECVAGNYLGNTTSDKTTYDPKRTTESPPTTALITTEGTTRNSTGMPTGLPLTTDTPGGGTGEPDQARVLSAGAIAGIAVGAIIAIAVIIVLIVVFVVKPDCIGGSGSPNTTTTHKHSTSAVGSSNGNEKEKIRPEAAPRGHSSIKHTTDNPQQAEYAMVDRKPGGRGDSTDARGNGAGQNEQPGMHYADLDLTSSAGHSDRVVPKNEDGVVVYSSILV